MKPLVSIILPTYNRVKMLKKAVESVLKQTYNDWELLVIDDTSSDGTQEVMQDYQKSDERIKYCRIPKPDKKGLLYYLNYGISKAEGKYIARLDDDDTWCLEDKLKMQVDFLDKNDDYVIVGGGGKLVNEEGKILFSYFKRETDKEIRDHALFSNPFTHTTVLYRRDVAQKLGGYKMAPYLEDWEFWLRLGMHGKMYNFKEYFTHYFIASHNNSFILHHESTKSIYDLLKTYKKHYPNYNKAVVVNSIQYAYSLLPHPVKLRIHSRFMYIKRKYF